MLAKALAHYFEAKLLLLDVTDFSLKVSCLSLKITIGFFKEKNGQTPSCHQFASKNYDKHALMHKTMQLCLIINKQHPSYML